MGGSEAGEVSQPVRAKRARAGAPVLADRTVKEINLYVLVISGLSNLTLVGHLNKFGWSS